ncbi:hypothetical protein Hanom_Chr17g01533321 [Helianthus anomalus]
MHHWQTLPKKVIKHNKNNNFHRTLSIREIPTDKSSCSKRIQMSLSGLSSLANY